MKYNYAQKKNVFLKTRELGVILAIPPGEENRLPKNFSHSLSLSLAFQYSSKAETGAHKFLELNLLSKDSTEFIYNEVTAENTRVKIGVTLNTTDLILLQNMIEVN